MRQSIVHVEVITGEHFKIRKTEAKVGQPAMQAVKLRTQFRLSTMSDMAPIRPWDTVRPLGGETQ